MTLYELFKYTLEYMDECADVINQLDGAYVEDRPTERLKLKYPDVILYEAFRTKMLSMIDDKKIIK